VITDLLLAGDLLGYASPGGRLILSGIIEEQLSPVESALRQSGGVIETRTAIRDWITLTVTKTKTP
jgi:ribosomal protein L11 methylase PrmA